MSARLDMASFGLLPTGSKRRPERRDLEALRDAYLFLAGRLKEMGSYDVSDPPGNRYIGGWAHGNVQSRLDAVDFEHAQNGLRAIGALLQRYSAADIVRYQGMLYRRYNFQGEVVLVPERWPADMIPANIAKVRLLGPDETKWAGAGDIAARQNVSL